MQINSNRWNKIRYSNHSVYYDLILLTFRKEREKAIQFSDVNRKFLDILSATSLKIKTEQPSKFRGAFNIYCSIK